MARVTFTPEALVEARSLLAADPLDGVKGKILRIAIGSCGLRRPVAAPSLPEAGDERCEIEGIPVAIAQTLQGTFHITVGRGRFGAWLEVAQTL